MTSSDKEIRIQLVDAARQALADGLVWGSAGNFSARSAETGNILITPSGRSYTDMQPEDIVETDLNGRVLSGKLTPSSETPIHCGLYRARPSVRAVVHTEPPHVNAFGAARREIPLVMHNLAKSLQEPVPLAPCMPSGTEAFAEAVLSAMGDRPAIMWPNHGLLVAGDSVSAAMRLTWRIENAARVFILASAIGTPHTLPEEFFRKPG